ncbi:MAG: glycosyltransferase family 4 protein [Candidatus Omnitrophica bacterium]|nr:glycosyltransferase family 4 protein [Candidatus Omnitrophota bacterium]
MKILILCNHLNIGGITSYVFLLAKGLVKYGHRVWVAGEGELVDKFKKEKIEVIHLNLKIKSEINPRIYTSTYKLKRYFSRERPDIIHAHTRTTSIISYYLSKAFKIPYITTCHGLYKIRWTRILFPFVGEFVVAISKVLENQLVNNLKLDPRKVRLIYNGIDLDYFSPDEILSERKQFGFKEEDFIIGNISRLVKGKGQEMLIYAMPRILQDIPQAKLVLVGDGRMKAYLEQKVKEFFLKDKVFFLGSLKDTRHVLKIMDLFCFLPSYEGFGLCILEAMAMKVPIIASNLCDLPYILEEGKAGILIPRNVESLVLAIVDLYRNLTKRKKLIEYAYTKVKSFSYLKMVEEIQKLYELALKRYER